MCPVAEVSIPGHRLGVVAEAVTKMMTGMIGGGAEEESNETPMTGTIMIIIISSIQWMITE
jgi:hypothetical protein